jgi:hypothetical protein
MSILSSSGPETRAWYFLISVSEQVQRRVGCPYQPHLRRAGYGHYAVLDGLAQRLAHVAVKLGQLVQKQHARLTVVFNTGTQMGVKEV